MGATVTAERSLRSVAHDAAEIIQVVGAGPAGLAAAITLARAGRRVVVHEAHAVVGQRFQGDFQGLENWSTASDVLDECRALGITTSFAALPSREGVAFDAWDHAYKIRSPAPFFYTVERGPGKTTLDTALLNQALETGVDVRFGSRVAQLEGPGVLAVGPKAADAIAVGYHFETDMTDGYWFILDDDLAPQGYAYVLVMGGRGTVKTCMFSGFKEERRYVERTVGRFKRLIGLEMRNERFHGGVGNFRAPASALSGTHPVAGEQAGFQDGLAGFGMRYAIQSGILAARSLMGGQSYDPAWGERLRPSIEKSIVNRAIYSAIGNRGYQLLLKSLWGVNELSGSVARNVSGFEVGYANLLEPDALATGGPEDEIRRSIRRMAGEASDAGGSRDVTGDVGAQFQAVRVALRG